MAKFNRLAVVGGTLLLAACGADSMRDNVNQERDRQRTNSATIAQDYRLITGTYSTANEDASRYWVVAQMNLTYVQKDGTLVPQPSLSGSFRIFDKSAVSNRKMNVNQIQSDCETETNPMKCGYVFAFSSGLYDAASKVLALHIQGYGVAGSDVFCTRRSETELNCRWEPASGGTGGFDFVLTRS